MKEKLLNLIFNGFSHCRKIVTISGMLLLTFHSFAAQANYETQNAKISINLKNATLRELMLAIEKESGYHVFFNSDQTVTLNNITINATNSTVADILNQTLKGSNYAYSFENNKTIVIKKAESQPQPKKKITIKGVVVDKNTKKPLAGATVLVKGTSIGAITDGNGTFSFQADDDSELEVSYVGMKPVLYKVLRASAENIIVNLEPETLAMDEVIVVGYGTQKKKDLTGSVSTIGAAEIGRASASSTVQSLLQGRVAGVNTQIQSASPTSPVSVIIRGQSSLKGDNQPLWVIDGVPNYSSTTSGNVSNTLYNLNLQDVENVTILRDASATAIYGSRAANGVVIVTTKSGKKNMSPQIDFSASVGFQNYAYNGLKYFEAEDYIRFQRSAVAHEIETIGGMDYFTRKYGDEDYLKSFMTSEIDRQLYRDKEDVFYDSNTNWQKEIGQVPLNQNYDLSLRGGSENTTYYLSLFYRGYDGVIKTGFSNTVGGNFNFETTVRDKVKFGIVLSGSSRKTNARDDLMPVVRQIRPDIPVYNEDGTYFTRDSYTANPLAILDNTNQAIGNQANVSPYVEWEIIKGLRLKIAPTLNYSEGKTLTYTRKSFYENGQTTNNSRNYRNSESTIYLLDNTLTYNKAIKKHDILATVGYSLEKSKSLTYGMNASIFADDDVLNSFTNASKMGSMSESESANALMSYFARVQYKFDEKYLLTATLRRDGSSKFGANNRWGTFPSVGLGWIINEEQFMKDVNAITYLKFRASVGKTGSQNLGNYGYYSSTTGTTYNDKPATRPNAMANPNLRWEESLMYDLGLDYGLFGDRLRGTLGWYRRETSSLIYDMPVPTSSAYSKVTANVASTSNTGIEFDVKYDIVQTADHLLTFDLNIAHGINKIEQFDGRMDVLYYNYNNTPDGAYMRTFAGGEMNRWFGYRTLRLFETAEEARTLEREDETGKKVAYNHKGVTYMRDGDLYIQDTNNDGKITPDDCVDLGSADPVVFGGFGLNYIWKNLQISANFTYSIGNKRNWDFIASSLRSGDYNSTNKVGGQNYSLAGPGAIMASSTPYDYQGNASWNSRHLYDASYLRLNNINVNYRFPSRFYRNSIISNLELSFQATNLFTLTRYPGMDPQGNWSSTAVGVGMGNDYGTYPTARTFTFGLKFSLK